tara:strand:+ start:10521 stop:11648 length:1128 start_codon:yes stop_codon:yes gene_type:complete
MKIIHIITSLGEGGAQSILLRICRETSDIHQHKIISLIDDKTQIEDFDKERFEIIFLNFNKIPFGPINGIFRLFRILLLDNSDVIQTWLYHADLFGGLIAKLNLKKNVIWNIRNCNIDSNTKFTTKLIVFILSKLSRIVPSKIIFNSRKSMLKHCESFGYTNKKSILIHNGFDTEKYHINNKYRIKIRNELKIQNKEYVLGMIARFHPDKNHEYLFQTLKKVKSKIKNFKCILVGNEINKNNLKLAKLIEKYELERNIILLGIRRDIHKLMNALDLHILSSNTEAFPNVLGEAMACGIPCVSTNVGDAKFIIGDTGWLVPFCDSKIFANTIITALKEVKSDPMRKKSKLSRERIIDKFSNNSMLNQFIDCWGNNL